MRDVEYSFPNIVQVGRRPDARCALGTALDPGASATPSGRIADCADVYVALAKICRRPADFVGVVICADDLFDSDLTVIDVLLARFPMLRIFAFSHHVGGDRLRKILQRGRIRRFESWSLVLKDSTNGHANTANGAESKQDSAQNQRPSAQDAPTRSNQAAPSPPSISTGDVQEDRSNRVSIRKGLAPSETTAPTTSHGELQKQHSEYDPTPAADPVHEQPSHFKVDAQAPGGNVGAEHEPGASGFPKFSPDFEDPIEDAEPPQGDYADDGDERGGIVRVPWLRYSDGPVRSKPQPAPRRLGNQVASIAPAKPASAETPYEPLLSEEEIRALMEPGDVDDRRLG